MTYAASLIKVGNSRAIIIPAKLIRQLNINENTILNLTTDSKKTICISKMGESENELVFPRIDLSKINKDALEEMMNGLVRFSAEEIDNDERLKYILR